MFDSWDLSVTLIYPETNSWLFDYDSIKDNLSSNISSSAFMLPLCGALGCFTARSLCRLVFLAFSSSALLYVTEPVMWFDQGVSSPLVHTALCKWCVCPKGLGGGSGVLPVLTRILQFTAARFSLLTNGSRAWSPPFTPPLHPAQHFKARPKINLTF